MQLIQECIKEEALLDITAQISNNFIHVLSPKHSSIPSCPRQKIGIVKQSWPIRNHRDCFFMPVFRLRQLETVQHVQGFKKYSDATFEEVYGRKCSRHFWLCA